MSVDKDVYAVVLAGGSGTRFWPMSRESRPKQFLNIVGAASLFQDTLKRIKPKIAGANIFIVTNAVYRKQVGQQTAAYQIPKTNILLEPQGKNTAPAICWAAWKIHQINPDAVLAVFPSDHLILHQGNFLKVLEEALVLARREYLVTLGIVPTRPETGYGYLKIRKTTSRGRKVVKVEKFIEKPSLEKARQFVRQKRYLWNSGMFIWKSAVVLKEFERHLPEMCRVLRGRTALAQIRKIWPQLPNISIDYGILEKADNVAAVPAKDIGWSDVGSWEALADVLPKDKNRNYFKGDVISLDCAGSFVWGEKRLIAAVGLEDLIVIDTPEAVLVCKKDMSQRIREIVSALKKNQRTEI
ncbi:MAG TPA: mannose-1-phosphate guanylyltransferase [Candidatus Omnitrophica bacterium]|nr:MAG: hypothetical protein A2Z81_01350 [Omnitrophica WOR_2 bacterium GWA2_45_18]HBR14481.1 mannose-1-phosphate guanylyltransferase [Candidatus Omnitrophota bacterium]